MQSMEERVDSKIDHAAAVAYWSATEPTINGVLGGYPQVSRIDLQGSSNFLVKLRRRARLPADHKYERIVDCGAGIGRITDGLLAARSTIVDIVEPVKNFTDQIKSENIGTIFNVGLEAWFPDPEEVMYDIVWNQWCLSQLTEDQILQYFERLKPVLKDNGYIIVKENIAAGEDVYDDTDSSVTRTDAKFRALFEKAELKLISTELQRGMPEGLYAVRSYALQPK